MGDDRMKVARAVEIEAAWMQHHTVGAPPYWRDLALRRRLSAEQNHRCCYCGTRTGGGFIGEPSATIEHVVPRSLGGSDEYGNLVMACRPCNSLRGAEIWPEHTAVILTYSPLPAPPGGGDE